MVSAARKEAPQEACGLLAGKEEHVMKCYVLTNADHSAQHFRLLPAEQFAAVKNMRETGLRMLAIWHSHPLTPARMSAEDLKLAFTPDVAYVIVSLADSEKPNIRAYQVNGETGGEKTEEIGVVLAGGEDAELL